MAHTDESLDGSLAMEESLAAKDDQISRSAPMFVLAWTCLDALCHSLHGSVEVITSEVCVVKKAVVKAVSKCNIIFSNLPLLPLFLLPSSPLFLLPLSLSLFSPFPPSLPLFILPLSPPSFLPPLPPPSFFLPPCSCFEFCIALQ